METGTRGKLLSFCAKHLPFRVAAFLGMETRALIDVGGGVAGKLSALSPFVVRRFGISAEPQINFDLSRSNHCSARSRQR